VEKGDFVGLKYKLLHAATRSRKRQVIDLYVELRGKSIREVNNMIALNERVMRRLLWKSKLK